ncbi:hypothetical protein TcCL_NonESM10184 [Trypanosoma cruzi]|nr:hypothetical protein TcCL_NonESM10184 [Trypanosoma cruzi]
MCRAPQPAIVNSTDGIVDCCFYRFVSFLSGCFQEFFPFHADCVEGDCTVALVAPDAVLYRTVISWSCVRGTRRPFCAMEEGYGEPPSGSSELRLCLIVGLHAGDITVLRSKAATE